MNKYVKQRQIGEGAFGKAILVRRKADSRNFVIKEINILKMSPKERQESKKEVAVLAQLSHPNIVRYRESFEEAGSLYIVMDFCEKGDLYSKINSQRGMLFPEDQVLDWFVQICLAIKHIHDRKILHRDIKSQNIFLTASGNVQLGDFGIAKVLGSTAELARTCIGTPYYLSPEIVENRPYNNKSDIWSLGCVLYELTTLKHAFEAGNMKNLVLKIIRGSYPPISPKYSYDLRGLIAALFKRTPRDRPSVNSILKKNFIQKRVSKFLSDEQIADEFSHTVMHGQKISRALPPPPPSSRPPAPKATPARKYDPASVYGAQLKKSKDNRSSAEKKRPGSAGPSRPGSAQGRPGSAQSRPGSAGGVRPSNSQQDLRKKRQALVEKEKKRQEEEKKAAAERKHKELVEKQRLARMNKAREEGWKNLMGSLGSDDGDKKEKVSPREQIRWPAPKPAEPNQAPSNNGDRERGKYDQYHAYLDKMQEQRNQRLRDEGQPKPGNPAAYMAAPRIANPPQPIPNWNRPGGKAPAPSPVYQGPSQPDVPRGGGHAGGGGKAEERARIVEDFIQRKREAAMNRMRGQQDIFGNVRGNNFQSPQQTPQGDGRKPGQGNGGSPMDARNMEEQEYLEKLRQIRQQNLHERKIVQQKQSNQEGAEAAKKDAELRKKKIEALRQQADDRAKQLREQLDKQRREMFNKDKMMREEEQKRYQGNRPGQVAPRPLPAKPAVGITGVLNAIGAEAPQPVPTSPAIGITGVLGAIGAVGEPAKGAPVDSSQKTKEQQQKEEILKRVNEKMANRPKWAAPEKPQIAESLESARQKWKEKEDLKLGDLPLEATASQMEVTSARDQVVKMGTLSENKDVNLGQGQVESSGQESARKQWGRPGSTVLRVLQQAPLEGTTSSDKSDDSISSPPPSSETSGVPGVGSTITISSKPSIQKGTIILKPAVEGKEDQKGEATPAIGATITLDKPRFGPSGISIPTVIPETMRENEKTQNATQTLTSQTQPSNNKEKNEENASKEKDEKSVESDKSEPAKDTDQSDDQKDASSQSKPSISTKPPLPSTSKPVVFPKPVLLPKPDKPMAFGQSIPSFVRSQGAGELFKKAEDKTDTATKETAVSGEVTPGSSKDEVQKVEETKKQKEEGKLSTKQGSGVILGLTVGEFDINNAQLLRTCSEPDLTKLTRTADKLELKKSLPHRRSLDLEELREEEDAMVQCLLANVDLEDEEEEGQGGENESSKEEDSKLDLDNLEDDVDDDDDEDELMSVRETMQSLLLRECSTDEEGKESVKFSLSGSKEVNIEEEKKEGDEDDAENEDDDGNEDNIDGDDKDEDDADNEDNDGEDDNEDNNEDEDENEDGNDDIDGVRRSESTDGEDLENRSQSNLFQSDESDADTQFGDDDDNYDLFSRLEESRAELETELGCDKFLKVYKTVQALQEDEDENIEQGAKLVTKILGSEKEHLYPKIFQLVMADAAFTEESNSGKDDNDES